MNLINRETGRPATPEEVEACKVRAMQILQSPYSSPQQVEWALQFDTGMECVPYRPSFNEQKRIDQFLKELEDD